MLWYKILRENSRIRVMALTKENRDDKQKTQMNAKTLARPCEHENER